MDKATLDSFSTAVSQSFYSLKAVNCKYRFKVVFVIYNSYTVKIGKRLKLMDYPIRTLQQIRPLLVGFRKRAGMSQAEVAALLGVTQQSYAKIEANPAATSVERLFTILRLLGSEIVLAHSVEAAEAVEFDTIPAPAAGRSPPKPTKAGVAAPSKVTPPSKKTEHW